MPLLLVQNSLHIPFHLESPTLRGKIKCFVSQLKISPVFCNPPFSLFNEMFVILVSLLGRGDVNESLLVLLFASSSLPEAEARKSKEVSAFFTLQHWLL